MGLLAYLHSHYVKGNRKVFHFVSVSKGSVKPLQQSQLLRRTVLNSQVTVLITYEIHEPPGDERRSIVSDQKRTFG